MTSSLADIVANTTIEVGAFDDLDRDQLLSVLKQHTFACIRGLVTPAEITAARERLAAQFSVDNDLPVTGEVAALRPVNYQKISMGRGVHNGVDVPRFARIFYNPFWEPDIYGLHNAFRQAAMVRNLLADMPRGYGIDDPDASMWTACRVHHYPRGGGFMSGHQDQILPTYAKAAGLDGYFQPSIILSKKGVDFESGGGFVNLRGEVLFLEEFAELGDIVIYDTHTIHGVHEVDIDKPFRQDSLAGRFSGLVSLYKRIW